MELNEIEILNMRCTNALNQENSSSDSDQDAEKSAQLPRHKKRPMEHVLAISQSAPVYPPTQLWPGPQFPYYGYEQSSSYKYPLT